MTYALIDTGRYLCCDPSAPEKVEWRTEAGAWEEVMPIPINGGYAFKFIAAHRALTVTPNGDFETRPVSAIGAWETFQTAEQPPDWQTILCARVEAGKVVGCVQLERQP